jgi:general stress protein 26
MRRVADFAEIAGEFERRWKRTVWAPMTTVDKRGRPRSRMVHPYWEGRVGWVITFRHSAKGRDLDGVPFASFTYWDQTNEQVHVECAVSWVDDLAEKQRVWNVFKDAPPPHGYDPGMFFKEGPADPQCGIARLEPWRLELWSLADMMRGVQPQVWAPARR